MRRLTLHSTSITITHPHSKETMTFEAPMPPYFPALIAGGKKPRKMTPASKKIEPGHQEKERPRGRK